VLCVWTDLNDHATAHDLLDQAIPSILGYLGRHPISPDKKRVLHIKGVIKRRARQQSARKSREIQYGALF
jgi:hypothetical protein